MIRTNDGEGEEGEDDYNKTGEDEGVEGGWGNDDGDMDVLPSRKNKERGSSL
jgi:hypothetical protein